MLQHSEWPRIQLAAALVSRRQQNNVPCAASLSRGCTRFSGHAYAVRYAGRGGCHRTLLSKLQVREPLTDADRVLGWRPQYLPRDRPAQARKRASLFRSLIRRSFQIASVCGTIESRVLPLRWIKSINAAAAPRTVLRTAHCSKSFLALTLAPAALPQDRHRVAGEPLASSSPARSSVRELQELPARGQMTQAVRLADSNCHLCT